MLVRFVDLRAGRGGQELHANIRNAKESVAELVDDHMPIRTDIFGPGAVALLEGVDVFIDSLLGLEGRCEGYVDQEDHDACY